MVKITSIAEVEALLRPYEAVKHAGPYKLDTMRHLMAYLDNPQEKVRVIHVAGTSGKTSTSYYIAALLSACGYKVGLSVSPHIDTVRERTQINLQLIDETDYCQLMENFLELIGQSGLQPSYFELMVAFSFWTFARKQLDFAVMEVGLGGLLDGTNVVSRPDKICVITDIGLDHQEILGDTISDIAAQKAGIIQPGNEVYLYEQGEAVMKSIRQVAHDRGGVIHIVDKNSTAPESLSGFQRRNFGLAAAVVTAIVDTLPESAIIQAAQITVPARMELLQTRRGTPLVIDGSHNAQKIGALVASFKEAFPDVRPILVVSFGHNRRNAMEEGLGMLKKIADTIIVTSFNAHQDVRQQSLAMPVIASAAKKHGFLEVHQIDAPVDAVAYAETLSPKMILITGSFYLLRHVRPATEKN